MEGSSPQETLLCSSTKFFNGFAAALTQVEVQKIVGTLGQPVMAKLALISALIAVLLCVISANSDGRKIYIVYMGAVTPGKVVNESFHLNQLEEILEGRNPSVESGVIIAVIDTGIWPESESLRDDGLAPAKWKGICEKIKCNNKNIGAQYYPRNDTKGSPIDEEGHGTHVASMAAGRNVYNADLLNLGKGTVRGAVPSARIIVYKVLTRLQLSKHTNAFEDAIADGVDIISISIGTDRAVHYNEDPIAIGAFHAMAQEILTSSATGNAGPGKGRMTNVAPRKDIHTK